MIKHIWFDFSGTMAVHNKENHNQLRYSSYASIVKKPLTEELIKEYEELCEQHGQSNAATFCSLGLPSNYWSERINSMDPKDLLRLADKDIPEVLNKLQSIVPISLFSNIQLGKVLPALGIEIDLFTHILSAGMVKRPKPASDGYYKMIEISKLLPSEMIYIGDSVEKDILPAKELSMITGLIWSKSDKADYCFENFKDILTIFE